MGVYVVNICPSAIGGFKLQAAGAKIPLGLG